MHLYVDIGDASSSLPGSTSSFLMIPSYFKIEILAIQDEFVLSGRKGLIICSCL